MFDTGVMGGNFVTNTQMIYAIKRYIYQETGKRVEIEDPELLNNGMNIVFQTRSKQLLLKAYAWANDHLKT